MYILYNFIRFCFRLCLFICNICIYFIIISFVLVQKLPSRNFVLRIYCVFINGGKYSLIIVRFVVFWFHLGSHVHLGLGLDLQVHLDLDLGECWLHRHDFPLVIVFLISHTGETIPVVLSWWNLTCLLKSCGMLSTGSLVSLTYKYVYICISKYRYICIDRCICIDKYMYRSICIFLYICICIYMYI